MLLGILGILLILKIPLYVRVVNIKFHVFIIIQILFIIIKNLLTHLKVIVLKVIRKKLQ